MTVISMAKNEIFYQLMYNKDQSNPELKLLQDILGASSFDMSDRALDITWEVASMLAIEALAIAAWVLTAWVWTAAINAAMLGRNAYRWTRAIEAYNNAWKIRRLSTTAGRILGSWVWFEAWAATTRSIIENGDLTSMHSKEWYIQSIAMMWVLKWVWKLIESGKFGSWIKFKEGEWFIKNIIPFTWQTIIEWSAIFWTTGWVWKLMFDWKDNWTPEQLAQAMLMAIIFKGTSKVRFSKTPDGTIKSEPEFVGPPKPKSESELAGPPKPTVESDIILKPRVTWKVDFTQAFSNWMPLNYRIQKLENGTFKVLVQKANWRYVEATERYWIPEWQSRTNYNERINNELLRLNS